MKTHHYTTKIKWTGQRNQGTKNYKSYDRSHKILIDGKYTELQCSSDPSFLGDASKFNPEDLFLSSLSACHMLWYLHLCTVHKIVVVEYTDTAQGIMTENSHGSGKFTQVTLYPKVKVTEKYMIEKANILHQQANQMCFIANSCNFQIYHQAQTTATDIL